jgi:acyl-[acyl-carrier-protein]-phospholipid O-acyltransferase/long-chain-fatty-acid--[acyl-carrier-protein] ligase
LSAQFLGSLNDNLLKMVVALAAAGAAAAGSGSSYLSLTSAVFILPYILFSGYAGFVADRFDKRRVLIVAKALEIVIMVLALGALLSGRADVLISILFLTALQATFFSPAKYGILPEMLAVPDLCRANGYLEMSRYGAIILGTVAGGVMMATWQDQPGRIGLVLIGIAAVGTLVSKRIAVVPRSGAGTRFSFNPWRETGIGLRRLARDRALWPAVAGITYFESLGALVMLNMLLVGKAVMALDDVRIGMIAAFAGIGVGCGSWLAGRLSGGERELSLVPLGALGVGVMLLRLSAATGSYPQTVAALVLLGTFGGLFLVPLNAMLQRNAAPTEKGQLIATNNFLNMLGVLAASFVLWLLHDGLGLEPNQINLAAGTTTIVAAVLLLRVRPDIAAAMFKWARVPARRRKPG